MFSGHFYHEHTRRVVTVFGTLFNDISVVRRDGSGNSLQTINVPLSYGPRQKFLARIRGEQDLDDPKMAIKLPRMSFEITSFEYDSDTQLQRGTQYKIRGNSPGSARTMYYPSTYRVGFELNIMAKHMDDALQILEQILPYFQPEYTVTVKEVNDSFRSDMPFTLNSVNLNDDYEGDFLTRRTIIYTLSFETRVKYYGPLSDSRSIIKKIRTNISDLDMTATGVPYWSEDLVISPIDAQEDDDYDVVAIYNPNLYPAASISFEETDGDFTGTEVVIGQTSGASASITSIEPSSIRVAYPDDRFEVGETVVGTSSGASFVATDIIGEWATI